MESFSNLLIEHQIQLALWLVIPVVILIRVVMSFPRRDQTVYDSASIQRQHRQQMKNALETPKFKSSQKDKK
jgi:hypothetical protein